MSNLNDIANYLDIKLNKTADTQKKQDKLVFALEHLDAAANMLAEEGNHLMSQAVTELMDRAVKKAEEERHLPEGSKKKLEVAKYLTELLEEATLEAHKELTIKARDREFLENLSEKLLHTYDIEKAYDMLVKDQTKLRNMHDDLLQLDQELGTLQHHSELDGIVEFLLSITNDMLMLYGNRYQISGPRFKELKMPYNIYKSEQSAASNEASRDDIINDSIEVIYDKIMGNVVENEPEVGEVERLKEHEYLPTDYRNRMEEALDQAHQESMPEDVRERDYYDYEPELDVKPKYDKDMFNDDDAQQLKDLW